jgi:hypothetical protein
MRYLQKIQQTFTQCRFVQCESAYTWKNKCKRLFAKYKTSEYTQPALSTTLKLQFSNPNVEVMLLLPNTTLDPQPMDWEIIKTFKSFYTWNVYSQANQATDSGALVTKAVEVK